MRSGHRYWLHHTMASSPRGCLSVSFWMESAPHEALLALLREELPNEPSWVRMPPMEGRLTVAAVYLRQLAEALEGAQATRATVARVLGERYRPSFPDAEGEAAASPHCSPPREEDAARLWGSADAGRSQLRGFVERAASLLSVGEPDVRTLQLVHYAERLLVWSLGLRGDSAHRAPDAQRRRIPVHAFCLASMLAEG